MGSKTAHSRSALPDDRKTILQQALLRRRAELRNTWKHFVPAECLDSLGSFATEVDSFLSGENAVRDWRFVAGVVWINGETSFIDSLRAIAVARDFKYERSDAPPPALLPGDLNKLSGAERGSLLLKRYRCPLDIGARSETRLAEEFLRQLMVVDRPKAQAGLEFDADLVLLKLNLVGIRALVVRDLRFLDALNYFFELPATSQARLRTNPDLLCCWLCVYAQLLSTPDW